uniref:Uncharacterized protein n=1 Tax=Arundo donax TaxID=35708 RepID=A0A0A9BC97_ARUDO
MPTSSSLTAPSSSISEMITRCCYGVDKCRF